MSVRDVTEIKEADDLADFDIYVFGSSTYHGAMMDRMKTFLFLAERIFDTMQNIYGMDMVGSPLMLKNGTVGGGHKSGPRLRPGAGCQTWLSRMMSSAKRDCVLYER